LNTTTINTTIKTQTQPGLTDVQAGGVWLKATAGEVFAARKQHLAKFCFRHSPDLQGGASERLLCNRKQSLNLA
jgi:hypothetical protein